MSNLREVNDDILKDWLDFREDAIASLGCAEDKKHDNFFDYICYWNEKYYRNGFCDGSQLVMGCFSN